MPMSGRLLGGVIAGGGGAVTLGLANKRGRERNAMDKSTEYTLGGAYYKLAWIGPCLTWKDP
jgi:hypothetical protein